MVANPDLVAIVFACDRPPPNPRLIDRFLVVAEYNEVPPILVANKIDLVGTDAGRERFGGYERIGYDVVYTSAKGKIGLEELRARLAGRLSIVTGPSGVGKSTLLNLLQPGLRIETGEGCEIIEGRGKHTTRHAELHRSTGRRRLRGRHARHPRARAVPDPPKRARVLLPRVPRAPRAVCIQRLHPPARAALWPPGGRRGRRNLGGPIRLVPTPGDRRPAFLVADQIERDRERGVGEQGGALDVDIVNVVAG